MVYAVVVRITFPENRGRKAVVLKTVSSFTVESSWQNLTDTAQIVIAKKLFFEEKGRVFDLIKRGDPVIIEGGYNGEYIKEFQGFVSEILDDMPVVLKCEDNMYILKRTTVNKAFPIMKLGSFLKSVVPAQFKINAMDEEIPAKVWSRMTVAQILNYMKDTYNVYSYFVGDTLVSGKIYTDNPNTEIVKYSLFGANCNVIKNDLKYIRKEDIQLQIMMKHLDVAGKIIHVLVGDNEGETQTFFTSTANVEQMKIEGKKILDTLKIDGYNGNITGFAIPFVKHGYTANILNKEYPEREGSYYVNAVTTTFENAGAYHRMIKLGKSATKQ